MSELTVIAQPAVSTVSTLLHASLADNRLDMLRSAVPYITTSGVQKLQQALHESPLRSLCLGSFDWCRSDPTGLEVLQQQGKSSVEVHDGMRVVARAGWTPTTPFHPKSLLFAAFDYALPVVGSANMSRKSLREGVEVDVAIEVAGRRKMTNRAWVQVDSARKWFDAEWSKADMFSKLASSYQVQCDRRARASAIREFSATTSFGRRGFTAEQLAQIARSQTISIEAGKPTARNSATPGQQVMMRPLTRVFFGLPPLSVPRMTPLASVPIKFDAALHADWPLEFAHDSMDHLNLPTSAAGGPVWYHGKILKFPKTALKGEVIFDLTIVGEREGNSLEMASQRLDLSFTMPSGRTFGFR